MLWCMLWCLWRVPFTTPYVSEGIMSANGEIRTRLMISWMLYSNFVLRLLYLEKAAGLLRSRLGVIYGCNDMCRLYTSLSCSGSPL